MCQAFARVVRQAQTQAAIVNLSSAAGIRGVPNRLPYAASKYGVVGITQTTNGTGGAGQVQYSGTSALPAATSSM